MQFAEIYGLFDPETNELRYIGKANNSAKRFIGHLKESRRKSPLYSWIASLSKRGLQPTMRVLEICPYADWERAERQHIFEARLRGDKMLNIADGGNAPVCSLEVRIQNGKNSQGSKGFVSEMIRRMGKAIKLCEKSNPAVAKNCRIAQTILRNLKGQEKEDFTKRWMARYPHDQQYEDRKTNSVSA